MRFPHWIDGHACDPAGDRWLDVFDPATSQVVAQVAAGDFRDVDAAIAAAQRAFAGWSTAANTERARWLEKLADALEARLEDFARAESLDGGKPIRLAREIEIPRAISNLRFFAHAATQFSSESHHGQAGLNYTLRQPLGVVATISPWNLPLYLLTWKVAPALAAGNTVVAKPAEATPRTATMLVELGGKNPTLIFADSDWKAQIGTIARSAFQNSGQICLCGSRILVERSIYADVRDALVAKATAMRIGNPLDDDTDLGPLVSQVHFDKVVAAIAQARSDGGRI